MRFFRQLAMLLAVITAVAALGLHADFAQCVASDSTDVPAGITSECDLERAIRCLDDEAMRLLLGSDWPGNVRELENAIEHSLAMGTGTGLTIGDLPPQIGGTGAKVYSDVRVGEAPTLEEVERRYILCALENAQGNHVRAAEVLGIDRRTIYRKLDKCAN